MAVSVTQLKQITESVHEMTRPALLHFHKSELLHIWTSGLPGTLLWWLEVAENRRESANVP
jgi:hypothetical protein